MGSKKPNGYWKDWGNFERELKAVIDDLGHFPGDKELRRLNKSSIAKASGYHGGLDAVREKFNIKRLQRPNGYWKDWGNFERELKAVIDDLGHFPTSTELSGLDIDLITPAYDYHGGLDSIRKKMGYDSIKKLGGYWEDWGNLKNELQPIIQELGHFPSDYELMKLKRSDIRHAIIRHHGGINSIKERMGYGDVQQLESLLRGYVGDEDGK